MMVNLSIGEDMGIEATRVLFDEQMQLSLEETFGGVEGDQVLPQASRAYTAGEALGAAESFLGIERIERS